MALTVLGFSAVCLVLNSVAASSHYVGADLESIRSRYPAANNNFEVSQGTQSIVSNVRKLEEGHLETGHGLRTE